MSDENTEIEPWELMEFDDEEGEPEELVPTVGDAELITTQQAADLRAASLMRESSPHVEVERPKPKNNYPMTQNRVLSQRRKHFFLEILARTGKPLYAAQAAGYQSTSAVRKLYNKDPEFAAAYDEAMECAGDLLEDEAVRRAVDGTLEAVFFQGKICGYKLVHSDGLLQTLLKAAKPDKYKDKKTVDGDINVNVGVALIPTVVNSEDTWEEAAKVVHDNHVMIDVTPGEDEDDKKPVSTIGRS